MEQVSVYVRLEFDYEQMKKIKDFLIENKDKPLNKLYKEIKNKPDKTEEEKLFINAYELEIKKEVCGEIVEKIKQKMLQRPKIKMRL
jgi:uncharacterized protein YaaW (UPF0174 family)